MSRVSLPTTRFTLAEFDRLAEADAFGTERVELLNGRLHFRSERRPHMAAISKAAEAILKLKRPTDWVVIQGTLRIDRFNAPDPDLLWLTVPIDTP
jgi:hypothetical protein